MNAKDRLEQYSTDEIRRILGYLGEIFQEARLVDPTDCKELVIDSSGNVVPVADCYGKWHGCDRCDNCISEQALRSGDKYEKFELVGDTIYWIISKPIALAQSDGEMLCAIEGLLESSIDEYAYKLGANPAVDRALLDKRGFYIDWATKTYNRRYFDEGVYLGYLNLKPSSDVGMAVFKISDKHDMVEIYGDADRDAVFRQLALLIEKHSSPRDIIIRMSDDSLLVIKPSASRRDVLKTIEGVEGDAPSVLGDARWSSGEIRLSSGMSWASPFERTDRHARALFREAEENAYLDRRGVRKEWDDLEEAWMFSVGDAVLAATAAERSGAVEMADDRADEDGRMATASDLADILGADPETADDPLVIWFREFAKKDRGRPSDSFRFPMPLMGTSFEPGTAEAAVSRILDTTVAMLADTELRYLRGDFGSVVRNAEELMDASNDLSVRVAAGLLCSMANMASGKPFCAQRMKERTENLCKMGIRKAGSPKTRAACAIVDSTIVTLFSERRESYAPISEALTQLPEGQRLYASYLIALQAFNLGEYGNSLGVINTALSFCSETYPVPMAYLHTMAACSYMALRRDKEAAGELSAAFQLTVSDGIIAPFMEHYVQLQGLLDGVLKKSDRALYQMISRAAEKYRVGWVTVVDPEEANLVAASLLTASEMTIAGLACRGWTNREISKHLGLSENTVKHRLSSVYQKLGINRRPELSKYRLT